MNPSGTTSRSRRGTALLVGLAALVSPAMAGVASANGGAAMAVDVTSSEQVVRGERDGVCTWEVASDVTVVNLTADPIPVNEVSYSVSWEASDGSGVVRDITVVDDGGLEPGITFQPDERRTFSPLVLRFPIPCDATFGDLAVRITAPQGTASGDAPFLSGGTAVPVGAAGLFGVMAVVGAVAARRRQQRSVRAGRVDRAPRGVAAVGESPGRSI